ncbi:hypothetical protein TI39_contig415g00029 [Zymoseptoria brevis]|uniref:Uncharacterized protein n=1 Tax=Zymoseptoria brevis TaxID=1047168 RepID=A0A0F4GLS7_9PEZI|nr:hypothetical protein TI39_contig415g00029 [Zymoseptoria brevis]
MAFHRPAHPMSLDEAGSSVPPTHNGTSSTPIDPFIPIVKGRSIPDKVLHAIGAWHECIAEITAMLIQVPRSVRFPKARRGLLHLLDPYHVLAKIDKNTPVVSLIIHELAFRNAARLRAQNSSIFPMNLEVFALIGKAVDCPDMVDNFHNGRDDTGVVHRFYLVIDLLLCDVLSMLGSARPVALPSTLQTPALTDERELIYDGARSMTPSPPVSPIIPAATFPSHTSARVKELQAEADARQTELRSIYDELAALALHQRQVAEAEAEDLLQEQTTPVLPELGESQDSDTDSSIRSREGAASKYWASLSSRDLHLQYKAAGEEVGRQLRNWGDPEYAQVFTASKETRMPAQKYEDLAYRLRNIHGPRLWEDPRFETLFKSLAREIDGRGEAIIRYQVPGNSGPWTKNGRHLQFYRTLLTVQDHLRRD